MADRLVLEGGQLTLTTDEGRQIKTPENKLVEMLRGEIRPPIDGVALPDGIKFVEWRAPLMCVVHQLPPHVRQLRWITDDSPAPFGPEAQLQNRRLSLPYAITFAVYYHHGGRCGLMGYNELYFRNEPLRTKEDVLGYPALLNVSRIDAPSRVRAWICTQHLRYAPDASWDFQLASLLDHTWNGGFNLSSEHHEGASWYGESSDVHPQLCPVDQWEKATAENDAFALTVSWKPASLNTGQLIEAMLDECQESLASRPSRRVKKTKTTGLVTRFLNYAQQAVANK